MSPSPPPTNLSCPVSYLQRKTIQPIPYPENSEGNSLGGGQNTWSVIFTSGSTLPLTQVPNPPPTSHSFFTSPTLACFASESPKLSHTSQLYPPRSTFYLSLLLGPPLSLTCSVSLGGISRSSGPTPSRFLFFFFVSLKNAPFHGSRPFFLSV